MITEEHGEDYEESPLLAKNEQDALKQTQGVEDSPSPARDSKTGESVEEDDSDDGSSLQF